MILSWREVGQRRGPCASDQDAGQLLRELLAGGPDVALAGVLLPELAERAEHAGHSHVAQGPEVTPGVLDGCPREHQRELVVHRAERAAPKAVRILGFLCFIGDHAAEAQATQGELVAPKRVVAHEKHIGLRRPKACEVDSDIREHRCG